MYRKVGLKCSDALSADTPATPSAASLQFQVHFHNDKTEFVAEHVIRLPHDSQVEDVLRELSSRLGPDYADRKLRLLEVYHSKIFKVNGMYDRTASEPAIYIPAGVPSSCRCIALRHHLPAAERSCLPQMTTPLPWLLPAGD